MLLSGLEKCYPPEEVKQDMLSFIEYLESNPVNLKESKICNVSLNEIINILKRVYLK